MILTLNDFNESGKITVQVEELNKMNKPIKKYRKGQVVATIWENEVTKNEQKFTVRSIQLEKSYKDGEEWKTTNYYTDQEIDKLIDVLNAYKNSTVKSE